MDTSPAELFGGEWQKIEDRMLIAASNTYPVKSTGGEATHKLTESELPKHRHSLDSLSYSAGPSEIDTNGNGVGYKKSPTYPIYASTYAGGDAAHNNMPPYYAVYTWLRTA